MKIIAFAGTNSSQSINLKLLKYVLEDFSDYEINLIDLNDYELPIFSEDREKAGYPDKVREFLSLFEDADAIICSMAEHNRTYSVAFKNIFDWASRIKIKIFDEKPMFLMSTSSGKGAGKFVMETANRFFPQFGADIKETYSLPMFYDNFENDGNGLTNEQEEQILKAKIKNFSQVLKLECAD
ncbi:MAG: NAD(P)H-dependent oxidoreductase [Bacteroidales bacterium]|jgi:NAD(P)H-dependent FMN reductase|nr:NAD(P)H-dependent oxidoreductase [Bacteroidales bacterium]MCK9498862.1 NAD(P)H-dependent oxidoreductase [Bacteroidales bacterium]MDY0314813.1 NAD(P)H-dependent oxidoreductase [Bacteroidales bacterium]NLB85984.1 NAD(P)H-dependent oxidoreductase [Bacteroidales bacterium]